MDLHENLKDKTVVITGGSGILCREFAYAYAKQGRMSLFWDVHFQNLKKFVIR